MESYVLWSYQSAKQMEYYSLNQVWKWDLKKQQNKDKITNNSNYKGTIRDVFEPFCYQISKRKINVYLAYDKGFPKTIATYWKIYELILFNIA